MNIPFSHTLTVLLPEPFLFIWRSSGLWGEGGMRWVFMESFLFAYVLYYVAVYLIRVWTLCWELRKYAWDRAGEGVLICAGMGDCVLSVVVVVSMVFVQRECVVWRHRVASIRYRILGVVFSWCRMIHEIWWGSGAVSTRYAAVMRVAYWCRRVVVGERVMVHVTYGRVVVVWLCRWRFWLVIFVDVVI